MFHCEKCGACCSIVGQTELYKHLDGGDGCCRYLDRTSNQCSIYDERPELCRVDDFYEKYLKADMSREEYYELNKKSCKILRELVKGE